MELPASIILGCRTILLGYRNYDPELLSRSSLVEPLSLSSVGTYVLDAERTQ
jgi:hypothetical protein